MTFPTSKPRSSCCDAPAKVNVMDPGKMFCKKCGKDCKVAKAPMKFSTISKVRKPMGERALFVELWAKQAGKCAVTGEKLLPPEHPMFHFQGSHGLPKGTYPEYRLDPRNIHMVTVAKHEEWHAFGDKWDLVKHDPRWRPIVIQLAALRVQAHLKDR